MNNKEVEDIYPLSPMQQGMMFHSLLTPESGMYVEQLSCLITGNLDVPAFRLAWQHLMDEHAVLRTSFLSKGLKEPLQIVFRKVEVPFEIVDWEPLTDNKREIEFQNYCLAEQMKGFDLSRAPLLRFTLARAGKDSYYFIWTYHHILLDGWSMPLLFREVMLIYEALSNGRQYSYKPVTTYRDYIVWLKKQNLNEAENFWRNALKDLEAPSLISNNHNENKNENVFLDIKDSLPEELMNHLQEFASANHLTMNTIVQGAWAILLSIYTRQKDVVFGAAVSGRPVDLPGAETIIGLLINTLPVRTGILPEKKIAGWLSELQMHQLEMRQYEYTPLSQIQKYTGIPNSLPLFDTLLVFENFPVDALKNAEVKGIRISNVLAAEKTNFPLVLVALLSNTLEFRLIADEESIKPAIARNMLENLKTIIGSFVKFSDGRLSDVEILCEREKQEILRYSLNPAGDETHCLHRLFELQAEKTPSNTAIVFNGKKLSYSELNKKANKLAHYLISLGVKRDSLVGVLASRSEEMIIAILAVMKAGAAYVPFDPNSPSERIEFIIKDAGLNVIVTQSDNGEKLLKNHQKLILIDQEWGTIARESSHNPNETCTPDNLAYVIYTSGSTGKPKGVLISHSGASNFVKGFSIPPGMNSNERGLQFFSLSFDGSVADIFPVLTSGAALYIPERETLLDNRKTEEFIRENSITYMVATPSILSLLDENKIPGLRTIISAGEILTNDMAQRFSSGRKFFNAYGPTETSVGVTMYSIDGSKNYHPSVPIGSALINTKLFILDDEYRLVPAGCVGELYIGGPGLARGYLNMPGLTAEKFIPNPYACCPGERIYRTGDLVRLLPEGNIEYIDRIDQQVKIRGFRVELGEIESVIRSFPGVCDAVVLARGNNSQDRKIVAYIIPDEEAELDIPELKKSCSLVLPDYMTPSRFTFLKEFPLNGSGKIDQKALPEPEGELTDKKLTYVAPNDTWECSLVRLYEEILDVHPVGIKDSFFELGGHSLLAIRLMDLIQERLHRTIPLVTIYQNPAIESLAPFLRLDDERKQSLIIDMKKNGSMEPLFFVHPSGGSVHWYSDLAKQIDTEIPFFGIQAIGIDGKNKLDDSIEVMASRYVGDILQRQPRGPYYIGGWSFGVIPAFEVACQLMALGAQVNMLALLDCGPTIPYEEPGDSAEQLAVMFQKHFQVDPDFLRQMDEQERFAYVFKLAKKNGIIPFFIRLPEFSFYIQILKTNQLAWRSYKIKTYPGQITFFRSEESRADPSLAPDMGWGKYSSKPVNVIDVPGSHISMMQPPEVRTLAGKLNSLIRNLRENRDYERLSEPMP
ncbi:MAG: amino acid adenylation domain-containing protein [Ignavibacteria bacterium]|jgi:amino acid adenylation domain-containing protein|nr:amino acid adenylation domain-containing protein [Ignavibacteria bacterium]